MRKTIGMVLAGGRVGELSVLTIHRPKAAVVFGGHYRIVDFALTNLTACGIEKVGILSQYRPSSLMDHVGTGAAWDLVGRHRGIKFLSPYQGAEDWDWYKGTADALYQNIDYIEGSGPDDVLIVSGDHVYRMDYGPLLALHAESGAEFTAAFTEVPSDQTGRFGMAGLAADGRINRYEEKPPHPFSNLASMTVYVFRRDVLVRELRENARAGKTFQIYDEILPRVVARGRAFGHVYKGYWAYGRTLDEFFAAHQDLVADPPVVDLDSWKIRSNYHANRVGDPPPTRYGRSASVSSSLVSPGCTIEGTVVRSVLSPDVQVHAAAIVRDSVLMHGTIVGPGARLERVIADKNVRVGSEALVGGGADPRPLAISGTTLACGAVVIGKGTRLPPGISIGPNVIVHPDLAESSFPAEIPSGTLFPGASG